MQKHGKKEKKTWSVVILTDSIVIKKKTTRLRTNLSIKCVPERKYGSDLFHNRGQHKTCLDIYYAEDLFGSS